VGARVRSADRLVRRQDRRGHRAAARLEGADAHCREHDCAGGDGSAERIARADHLARTGAHRATEVGADARRRSQWARGVLVKRRHVLGPSAERRTFGRASTIGRTVTNSRAVANKRWSGAEAVQPHRARIGNARGRTDADRDAGADTSANTERVTFARAERVPFAVTVAERVSVTDAITERVALAISVDVA
jgi:hypothetical protein